MSRERAHQRAERERVQAAESVRRARKQDRADRRRARRRRVTNAVPDLPSRRPGLLAARHRRRLWALTAGGLLIQLAAWIVVDSWGGRALVLLLTLFAAPVVWTLVFDRR